MDFKNMRKFHNWIKRKMYNKYTKCISNLLELAVGKSGDLDKWYKNKIKNVIGYDIDSESIINGKNRIKEYQHKFNNKSGPYIELYVKDLSKNVLNGNNAFDVIVCNFAFHYFFESKESFINIIHSIENNLKKGGIFMGCFFDDKQVSNFLKKNKKSVKSGSFKLKKIGNWNENSLFGNKLSVYLPNSVLNVPTIEYIINFDIFVKVMDHIGFELIETFLFKELNSCAFNLNFVEKQFSFLNRYFVFKRNYIR